MLADLSCTLDASYGEEFFPPLWAAMQADGVPVGVPHHTDTSALAFNLDHLEQAGVTDVPTTLADAWTWDEFVAVLQQLKDADLGAAPFAFNYQAFGAYRWFNTLYQAGGQVLDGRAPRRSARSSRGGPWSGRRACTPTACTSRASSSAAPPTPTRSSRPARSP